MPDTPEVTRTLARHALGSRYADIPPPVRYVDDTHVRAVQKLIDLCWDAESLDDIGAIARAAQPT